MARSSSRVTFDQKRPGSMPSWTGQGVITTLALQRRGLLPDLADKLRIHREGGYCGFDVFLFLLHLFSSDLGVGVKTFAERVGPYSQQLAALSGRRRLPSQAAMSRALGSVEHERTRDVTPWLLLQVPDARPVLESPTVLARDAAGEGWHVFDLDGSVTVLRHRALPSGEDLVEARRRATEVAPGYAGRKRGNVQLRRSLLQHAGSGLWVDSRLSPGNGERRRELPEALESLTALCQRLDFPQNRALVRADGEYGWVSAMTDFRRAGVPFITRLTRPALLEQADVARALEAARWEFVPDSKSGPRRSATDLGTVTLHAADGLLDEGGIAYEPIDVRVVVTRMPREGKADHGVAIDGWQYELFAVDLPPAAWPAPEAVSAYFGRATQENRFAQEDRELGLDRIFSHHLPGQEFATLVGLMVWNFRLCEGFALQTPVAPTPIAVPRTPQVDDRPVPARQFEAPVPSPPLALPALPTPEQKLAEEVELVSLLDALPWPQLLQKHPGWSWEPGRGGLRCPDDRLLLASCVYSARPGERRKMAFRRPDWGCSDCVKRVGCLRSSDPRTGKLIAFVVHDDAAERIATQLQNLRSLRRPRRRNDRPAGVRTPIRRRTSKSLGVASLPEHDGGTYAVQPALFLPAAARKVYAEQTRDLDLDVLLQPEPPAPTRLKLVAGSTAEVSHRRLTWGERLARFARRGTAGPDVTLRGVGAPLRDRMNREWRSEKVA